MWFCFSFFGLPFYVFVNFSLFKARSSFFYLFLVRIVGINYCLARRYSEVPGCLCKPLMPPSLWRIIFIFFPSLLLFLTILLPQLLSRWYNRTFAGLLNIYSYFMDFRDFFVILCLLFVVILFNCLFSVWIQNNKNKALQRREINGIYRDMKRKRVLEYVWKKILKL